MVTDFHSIDFRFYYKGELGYGQGETMLNIFGKCKRSSHNGEFIQIERRASCLLARERKNLVLHVFAR
jgi:hypothetical protein